MNSTSESISNYQEIRVRSIEECLDLCRNLWHKGYYFRGHADATFGLSTSLERYSTGDMHLAEEFLSREFRRRLHHFLSTEDMPGTTFELLSLMQHYGAPTRLLDLSRSPYVALYFAIRNTLNRTESAVWATLPDRLNKLSISRLSRNISAEFDLPIENLTEYDLIQAFTEEKYFTEAFLSRKHDIIMALEPHKVNARLNIQQGLFLVSGNIKDKFADVLTRLLNESVDYQPQLEDQPIFIKCIIANEFKAPLLLELDSMNINAATLFGGLEGFAISLKELTPTLGRKQF